MNPWPWSDRFAALAGAAGYRVAGSNRSRLASGKAFQEVLLEVRG